MWKPLFAIFRKETEIDKAFRNSCKMLAITEKMFLESKRSLHHINQKKVSIDIYEKDIKVNKLERKIRKRVQRHLQEHGRGDIYPGVLLVSIFIDIERSSCTGSARNRYLKVTINVELYPRAADEAGRKRARIRDSIINLLSSKSYADLVSVNGKYQLRDEIAARINLIISMGRVNSVYFTEFVIQ